MLFKLNSLNSKCSQDSQARDTTNMVEVRPLKGMQRGLPLIMGDEGCRAPISHHH